MGGRFGKQKETKNKTKHFSQILFDFFGFPFFTMFSFFLFPFFDSKKVEEADEENKLKLHKREVDHKTKPSQNTVYPKITLTFVETNTS